MALSLTLSAVGSPLSLAEQAPPRLTRLKAPTFLCSPHTKCCPTLPLRYTGLELHLIFRYQLPSEVQRIVRSNL